MKFCFSILLIVVLMSCNRKDKVMKSGFEKAKTQENIVCNDSLLMNRLLQKVIDIEELQQYYLVDEVRVRGYLVLKKNKFISKEYSLNKLNNKVLLLDDENLNKNNITAFLEFNEVLLNKDKASIILTYLTQGLQCTAQFKKEENCDWILISNEIVEM